MKKLLLLLLLFSTFAYGQKLQPIYQVSTSNSIMLQNIPKGSMIMTLDSLKMYYINSPIGIAGTIRNANKTRIFPLAQDGVWSIINEPNQLGIRMSGNQIRNGNDYWITGVAVSGGDTSTAQTWMNTALNLRNIIQTTNKVATVTANQNLSGGGDFTQLRVTPYRIWLLHKPSTKGQKITLCNDSIIFSTRNDIAMWIDTLKNVIINENLNVSNYIKGRQSFAVLYDSTETITSIVTTHYTTLNSFRIKHAVNITATDSTITVGRAGYYEVSAYSSFKFSVNNKIIHFSIFVNDEESHLEMERKISISGDTGNMSMSCILLLPANAVIKLKGITDGDGDVTRNHSALKIRLIDN